MTLITGILSTAIAYLGQLVVDGVLAFTQALIDKESSQELKQGSESFFILTLYY
jgi:hypothetical protein